MEIKNNIDNRLKELHTLRNSIVQDIITYFKTNTIIFKYPCVIENPTDTMIGGITITQIRKGEAIEATEEYELNSYDVALFDDNTLLRLYEWEQTGQYQLD